MKQRLCDFTKSPIFALRRKPLYYRYYDFVKEAFQWDSEYINEWQWTKVREIVNYAFIHVPFYRKLYESVGFELGDLKTWNDFEKLPSVSKSDIKKNPVEFYSDEIGRIPHREETTGGSTGQAMKFIVDDDLFYREDAVYRYFWSSMGFEVGDKCVILRGHRLIKDDKKFRYSYNPSWKYLMLDSSYISKESLLDYDRILKKFNARNIQAYPSSLLLLARTYKRYGVHPPRFQRVFLGSENVYDDQIELIREVFHPEKIVNQYGHTERVLLAFQNLEKGGLGFVPFYGYMELLEHDLNRKADAGRMGEITGTGFSKSMPFIRYRTNDFAPCSGKAFSGYMGGWKRIEHIEGRLQEFIVASDNHLISTCEIAGSHIPELSRIWDMQYYQDKPGEIQLNAILRDELNDQERMAIEKKVEQVLGNRVVCKINFVQELSRTNRNKKMMIIQKLNVKEYM